MLLPWSVRFAALASVAAATAAVTLAQLDLPPSYWKARSGLLYLAVVVLAVAAVVQLGQMLRLAASAKEVRAYERNMRAILTAGIIKADEILPGSSIETIGIHVFRVRGRLRRRLVNIGGLRLRESPHMSGPRWTRGKGVVGRAWREQCTVAVDWESTFAQATVLEKLAFEARPRDERFGMTWGEFCLTRGYKRIAAAPILDARGKLLGCVALDSPSALPELQSAPFEQLVHDVAVAIVAIGNPPPAWTGWQLR